MDALRRSIHPAIQPITGQSGSGGEPGLPFLARNPFKPAAWSPYSASAAGGLAGGGGFDGERVDAVGEVFGERLIDHAMPLHAAPSREGGGDDPHAEMRFAVRMRAGMAGVELRLVDDGQHLGGEGRRQLSLDAQFDRHDDTTFFR